MNFVQTTKSFSVQALFRTATLTVLGAATLLTVPAHAGLIYSENFSQVTIGTPVTTPVSISTQMGTGEIFGYATGTLPDTGGTSYDLTNTGWQVSSNSVLPGSGGDTYVLGYGGSGSNCSYHSTGYASCGMLLNTSDGGGIQTNVTSGSVGLTGAVTAGQAYELDVQYFSDFGTAGTATPFTLAFTVNGVTHTITTTGYGTSGVLDLYTSTFVSSGSSISIAIQDTTVGTTQGAPVIASVSISAVPEPTSALFLLIPAAGFVIRRRYVKK